MRLCFCLRFQEFKISFTIAFLICSANFVQAQPDSSLLKKITVSGVSLCVTTIDDLRRTCADLTEVQVQEMDSPEKCYGQDARFIDRKGYSSQKYPGIIFQTDEDGIYVSKIRLTKTFEGKLPDGTPIKAKNLLLKDVLKIYPALTEKWYSRDCSDYWRISDDTLAFYVKIDSSKPRYPVDEAFYSERPIEGIDLVAFCYSTLRDPNEPPPDLKPDPILFMDSVNITRYELEAFNPDDIASISVYKDSNAIKLVGPDGKYGVVYIHTKKFVREKYQQYFSSKSAQYRVTVPGLENVNAVAYMLNGKIVEKDTENTLASINDTNLISLKVITDKKAMKELGVKNKKALVVIVSKR